MKSRSKRWITKIIAGIKWDNNHLLHINGKYLKAVKAAALWKDVAVQHESRCVCLLFQQEGKERGKQRRVGALASTWAKATPNNDVMCIECPSGRIPA